MSEWINVKDRLPDEQMTVIIFDCGDIFTARFCKGEFIAAVGECKAYDDMGSLLCGSITTHWMPLPTPPQEKK